MPKKSIENDSDLITERFNALKNIYERGDDPYPRRFERTATPAELQSSYSDLDDDEWSGDTHSTAGRIKLTRRMGQIAFFDIEHDGETVQLYFQTDELDDYDHIDDYDLGDIIGVTGEMMKTRTGEVTVDVRDHTMLSKSVRPLPDKYHGVQDDELRYRKRYLDLMMNEDTRETFEQRSAILRFVRSFLDRHGFMEAETPTLHPIYGGAEAEPFTTHHNDLDEDLFLRISPELYLKRLLVGGYPRVYDLNKNYRNESIDTTHNPEYTMLEAYQAYADYEDMMRLTESLFAETAEHIHGTTDVEYDGDNIDFAPPWDRVTMLESIEDRTGLDAGSMTTEELGTYCAHNDIDTDGAERWGDYVQAIFEEECEHTYTQPTFITDHPASSTPLCKQTPSDDRLVERFEPICAGMEVANAYTELNDPEEQRERLVEQAESTGQAVDEDFLEAIEHAMPPAGGLGVGIDRLVMLLLDKQSIKDVILFPAMKQKEAHDE